MPLFRIADSRLAETSAFVAAPDGTRLYAANDSGDRARVFVLDLAGRTVAVQDLRGVRAVDVEDAGLGPGGALYLADTGDNDAERRDVRLQVVPEPQAGGAVTPRTAVLTYEDGPHDAEALLVHPRTGQVLVVTKTLLAASVYAAPLPLADGVLRRVAGFVPRSTGTPGGPVGAIGQRLVTGGSVSPDGRRLALRTYTDAYVFEVPGDDLVAALDTPPLVLPLPPTRQGEALTWTADGEALLTATEGASSPVYLVPVPAAAPSPSAAAPAPMPTPAPTPTHLHGVSALPDRDAARTRVLVRGLVAAAVVLVGVGLAVVRRRRQ